jgi:MFS family permease/AcrR family transcriptional regulator
LLVGTLVYSGLVVSLVGTLGTPLIPLIVRDQHVSFVAAQWMLTVTLLVGAVAGPTLGRLGDGPWRKGVLTGGLGAVLVGAAVAATATGFRQLLVGRALMGFGLGLMPLTFAIARDCLPRPMNLRVVAVLSVTVASGTGLGYPLTGTIADHVDYHYAFWLAALLGAVAIGLIAVAVPGAASRGAAGAARERQPFDVPGALLIGLALGAVLLGFSQATTWGWASPAVLGLFAGGVVLTAAWFAVERTSKAPLVELRYLTPVPVLVSNGAAVFMGFGLFGIVSLIIRLVETPLTAGYGFGGGVSLAGDHSSVSGLPAGDQGGAGGRAAVRHGERAAARWPAGRGGRLRPGPAARSPRRARTRDGAAGNRHRHVVRGHADAYHQARAGGRDRQRDQLQPGSACGGRVDGQRRGGRPARRVHPGRRGAAPRRRLHRGLPAARVRQPPRGPAGPGHAPPGPGHRPPRAAGAGRSRSRPERGCLDGHRSGGDSVSPGRRGVEAEPRGGRGPVAPVLDSATRRRDAGRSRARLLAAAAELFAERGYTGTALRAVAERAGVDAALIARYYGGKDGLYQAVLAADPVVGAARAAGTETAPTAGPPAAAGSAASTGAGDVAARHSPAGDAGTEHDDVHAGQDAPGALADLLARLVERWGDGPASTVGQNVFRCDVDDAARAATSARLAEQVLPVLRAAGPQPASPKSVGPEPAGPEFAGSERADAELRAELGAMLLLGIGVARTAGTLPALAAADPARLAQLAGELLDALLG